MTEHAEFDRTSPDPGGDAPRRPAAALTEPIPEPPSLHTTLTVAFGSRRPVSPPLQTTDACRRRTDQDRPSRLPLNRDGSSQRNACAQSRIVEHGDEAP